MEGNESVSLDGSKNFDNTKLYLGKIQCSEMGAGGKGSIAILESWNRWRFLGSS